MKTPLYLLLFAALTVHATAQEKTLDQAHMKCMYRATELKDTLDVAVYEDLLVLQVGPRVSKCYSYYTAQNDSLHRTPEGQKAWSEMFNRALADLRKHRNREQFLNSFPHGRTSTIVYKNHPAGALTVTDYLREDKVTYVDTLNGQAWTLNDSTKEVLGYTCQQATCDFRGRRWTAWFAPDIPVSDGPWKLGGLPGLILEAYDHGHQYTFTTVGLEQVKDEPIVFTLPDGKGGYRTTDRRAFLRAKMFDQTHGGALGASGSTSTDHKPVYRDLIERDYK